MTFPELCVKRPVFTTMLILLPVVLGLVGFVVAGMLGAWLMVNILRSGKY